MHPTGTPQAQGVPDGLHTWLKISLKENKHNLCTYVYCCTSKPNKCHINIVQIFDYCFFFLKLKLLAMWCVLSALWPKTKSEELSYNQNFMEWIDLDNVNIPLKLKTARKHCTRKLFYKCKSNQRQNIRGAKNYKFQWDYVHFSINEFIQHQIHGSQQSPKMHCFLSFCPYEMHARQFLTIFFQYCTTKFPLISKTSIN